MGVSVGRRLLRTAGAALLTAALAAAGVAQAGAVGMDRKAEPRIVGGSPASVSQYPWVVALATSSGFQFCGGSLISSTLVATAAHCVAGRSPADLRVVAGRTDLSQPGGAVVDVTQIWVHPSYTAPERGGDAALLSLDRALSYQTVSPAQRSDRELYAPGTMATVVGWGRIVEDGPQSVHQLQAARVPLLSDAECRAAYGDLYNPRAMVCAGYPQGGVDACQGDSGGPLMAGGKLIGLVSWGDGCARPGRPGVYTRVSSYFTGRGNGSVPAHGAGQQDTHLLD
jgi:trypsin